MADEDIHRPTRACDLLQRAHSLDQRERERPGRFPVSWEVHGEAREPGGRKRLTETKERLFRGGDAVGKQRDGMRTRACREELKRRSVPGESYGLDADAGLDTVLRASHLRQIRRRPAQPRTS